ncbi:hypothetical protein C2845_PM17G05950 [Panicum miliaceum]|uniref:CCHC-type domain-containing protein n=1 Tax=Panicum miliaceum TaxID=4540 RepID=A0A3L6Q2W7_PANMI|nr:hypothetical protein C2845_PM17G05950 [Panicum miliaceum]
MAVRRGSREKGRNWGCLVWSVWQASWGWRARQEGSQYRGWNTLEGSETAERDRTTEKEDKKKDTDEEMIEAEVEEEGSEQGGGGVKCSRCTKRGHATAKCVAELLCVICNAEDHVNHRCPLLKQSRPVAHAVGYAVHGLGFYHITHAPLPRSKKESRSAVISMVGGVLTKEQVVVQLQRIFPGKWSWELSEHEQNVFITKFPSRQDL